MLPIALALAGALSIAEVPDPRHSGGWVADEAHLVSSPDREAIADRLEDLRQDLGVEVAVVTVPEVDTTPKEFATALFKRWGLGRKGADNGLLVLLVRDRRRLEMETGYGLEPILTDGWLGTMQNQVMVPKFKAGDLGGGLLAGVKAVDAQIREHADEAREGSRRNPARPDGSPWLIWLTGALALGTGTWLAWRWRASRCPRCGAPIRLLDEKEDDEHLSPGQRKEERIRSVDYRVKVCTKCDFRHVERHPAPFLRFFFCPKCSYRTLRRYRKTLIEATYDHGGEVHVTERCYACRYRDERTERTPLLEHTVVAGGSGFGGGAGTWGSSGGSWGTSDWGSSGGADSGGGGSDFGGGESGGGGAGSSW